MMDLVLKLQRDIKREKNTVDSLLTNRIVTEIRAMQKENVKPRDIAKRFPNIPRSALDHCIYRETWNHIP